MKTSKRLLSILLMLTMLVSMFTVMASAVATDDTPETKEPATSHKCTTTDLIVVPGKEPTCTATGLVECYKCDKCEQLYSKRDAVGMNKITEQQTIPATGHKLTEVEAEAATCTKAGNPKYYHCASCGKDFANATDTEPTATPMVATAKTINPTGHKPGKVTEAQAGNCVTIGNVEYTQCTECEAYLTKNSKGEWVETDYDAIYTRGDHNLKKVDAKPATCTEAGNPEYYHCKVCGKDFKDAEGKVKIKGTEKIIPALGHKLTKVEAKAPTQTEEGNIEYWKCSTCGKCFDDKDGTNVIDEAKTKLPKLTPSEPEIPQHTLTVKIGENGKLVHKDDGREVTNGREFELKGKDKDNKEDELVFVAKAKDDYTVVWTLDGKEHDTGKSEATISISYSDLKATGSKLTVSFKEVTTAARKLYVDVTGWSRGDIDYRFYDGDAWKSWDDFTSSDSPIKLKKGQKVRFELDADSGYVAKWAIDKDAKSYKTDFTVTYEDIKNGSTLYISFVKKGSSDADDYPTLTFDITGGKHGTVTRNNNYKVSNGDVISIKKNDTRTFKADPDKGYVAVWTFQGESYVGNKFTLKMGSKDATLYIEFMDEDDYRLTKLPFRDVSERDWYYDDVVYVYRNGLMEGVSSTKFAGSQNTTRGQIVTILWRLTGEPRATKENKFTDVSYEAYYNKAISWAAEAGIVEGFDAKTFKPDQNVTREQLAAILYRYASYMNLSTKGASNLTKFDDYYKIGTWARDAMAWANYRGLINGTSATRIDPKGYATRAQIAAILHRFAVEFGA